MQHISLFAMHIAAAAPAAPHAIDRPLHTPAGLSKLTLGRTTWPVEMAFWGVEVKPGKAVPFVPPPEASKLHLSQVRLAGREDGEHCALHCLCSAFLAWQQGVWCCRTRCMPSIFAEQLPAGSGLSPASAAARPPPHACQACPILTCCKLPNYLPHVPLQACLSTKAKPGTKAALRVRVSEEGQELLVCSLREGGTESVGLDLVFDQ